MQPGSLIEHSYKVKLPPGADAVAISEQANERFPTAGWSVRTSDRAAPSLQRNIERFSQFLTLVGLTALIVGGVGVANAVNAYLDSKRQVIATFKSLGAGGTFVVTIYLIQIMTLALVGVMLGLVLGALAPFATARFLESVIPVAASASIYPGALALAAVFGLLTSLAFALLPLGRTRDVPATALFREMSTAGRTGMRWSYLFGAIGLAAVIAALALGMRGRSADRGDFPGRHRRCLPDPARRRLGHPASGAPDAARRLDAAQACHRQHPPAGRADLSRSCCRSASG